MGMGDIGEVMTTSATDITFETEPILVATVFIVTQREIVGTMKDTGLRKLKERPPGTEIEIVSVPRWD
tara:strand:- start:331 stop:534 length:204 start_codon:yes stop_codon:yes gene_type:complete